MNELYLIKFLLKYNIFTKYAHLVNEKFLKINNREIHTILYYLKELQGMNDGKNFSVDDLAVYFYSKQSHLQGGNKDLYDSLFESLKEMHLSDDLAEGFFVEHLKRVQLSEIAEVALDALEGRKSFEDVINLLNDDQKPQVEQANIISDDLQALADDTVSGKGLYWRSKFLNQSIGPLRKGNFGFYFARPETGKTAFQTSESSFMYEQLEEDEHLIVVLNEEPGQQVKLRWYCAQFGIDMKQLIHERDHYQPIINKKYRGRIIFYDNAGVNRYEIERLCKEYKPGLIWIDQIDKVYGFSGERPDIVFKRMYQWGRELSKKYAPVVGVCQAAGSGEGKLWLELDDVDGSKTAKQGEADWIIGIGKGEQEFLRGFHVLKNKLGYGEDCVAALRHAKQQVIIVPEYSRYEDME
jgi:hypothetical protein